MKKAAIKEKINNHTELRKSLWVTLVVLTGGLATLALNLDSIIKIILFFIGIPIDVFIFISICEHNNIIEGLIKELENKE